MGIIFPRNYSVILFLLVTFFRYFFTGTFCTNNFVIGTFNPNIDVCILRYSSIPSISKHSKRASLRFEKVFGCAFIYLPTAVGQYTNIYPKKVFDRKMFFFKECTVL